VSQKYRDEVTDRQNYPRPGLLFKTAVQAAREARQGVGFEIDVEAFAFYFRDCKASEPCQGVPGNGLGTVAILEINNKVEPSPRRLDSLE
jgi:hypothetical protein